MIAKLLSDDPALGPFDGVAYAYWGALALLCLLGLRYPLKMVPVLLMFLLYKLLWLSMVALPLWSAGAEFDPVTRQFTIAMIFGVVIDLAVIPWGYVTANYVRPRAERGKAGR